MKIISVKVVIDNSQDKTRLIKDIDTNRYTLFVGKDDANKDANVLMTIHDKTLKAIQKEQDTKDIKIIFI